MDTILHSGKPCPKLEAVYTYCMEQSPEARETFTKYKDLIQNWAQYSPENLTSIKDVTDFYKKLMTEKLNGNP